MLHRDSHLPNVDTVLLVDGREVRTHGVYVWDCGHITVYPHRGNSNRGIIYPAQSVRALYFGGERPTTWV